jgi:hypothetical protein
LTEKKHGRAAKRKPLSAFQAEWRANQAESLIKKHPKSNGSADDDESKANEPTTSTLFPDGWLTVPDLTPDPSILTAENPPILQPTPDACPTHRLTVLTFRLTLPPSPMTSRQIPTPC